MVSSNNYTYSIEDSCKYCGKKIKISDIKSNSRIVGRIVECPHCNELHRVDNNLNLESIDCFLDRQQEMCMPDTHAGKGCVIGFTANLGDKVVPDLVGVSI